MRRLRQEKPTLVAALRRAVFRQLLSDCLEEPQLSEAAAELAAPRGNGSKTALRKQAKFSRAISPKLRRPSFPAFAKLADAVRRYPQL